jgi:hypothetical protein
MAELTHYLRLDHRKEILEMVLIGFQKSIDELHSRIKQIHWYDGGWFVEEAEPILGLAFVAFQNYINSSIYDRFETLNTKTEIYRRSKSLNDKRTDIELIIAIANYYKHRDDDHSLHQGTEAVLNDLGLKYKDIIEPEKLPIIKGTEMLSQNWDLNAITKMVTDWRESLWDNNYRTTASTH